MLMPMPELFAVISMRAMPPGTPSLVSMTVVVSLPDMLATVWTRRCDYDIAQIDVYSGAAFFWAEAVAFALRRLGKPYVLTLHGGALPDFAREWPRRTRRLLESAAAVTAPAESRIGGVAARL